MRAPGHAPPLALVGPTATGKTEAALAIAERLDAEICSVDSMLVYRGMDIGTAKPTEDERRRAPHHLLDLADPAERFTVARFQRHARSVLDDLGVRGIRPLLVGGSGLYFRAIVDDLEFPPEDPTVRAALEAEARAAGARHLLMRLEALDRPAADRIEPGNVRRIVRALEVPALTGRTFSSFAEAWAEHAPDRVRAAGIRMPSEVLRRRIRERIAAMLERGWLDEVRRLIGQGFGGWLTSSQAIGYTELASHVAGTLTLDDAVETTVKRTSQLARRQMAWFRRDPRIVWFDVGDEGAGPHADTIAAFLEEAPAGARTPR